MALYSNSCEEPEDLSSETATTKPHMRLSRVSVRTNDLQKRLAGRLANEALPHQRRKGSANPLLARCDRIIKPLLELALRGVGLYGRGVDNALQLQVRYHRLSFSQLPEALAGFRLLHISDLHIDGVDGLAEVLCSRLSELPVDLCVLTGDYRFAAYGPCDGIYPRMKAVVDSIQSRLGVLGILGNHDCAEIALELQRFGVRMLIDESIELERGVWITGADDTAGDDTSEAMQAVPAGAFHLMLAHTPDLYAEAAAADVALYLCGHTHGGQLCLPGGIAPILNARCPRPYAHGLWKHGNTVGYTTSGAGCCMLPVRYNCPPEITLFELIRD